MSDRPSEGMTLDELREEFDWISEFQSRMAERICGDADVHNLVDYVGKLESENASLRGAADGFSNENAKLRELIRAMWGCISHIGEYDVFYYDMAEDGCGMSCTVNGEHCCADKLYDRMRELGVVDQ